jgi:hypothetical protein
VAQLTPPPDPRRTDREALARRRSAQVEAALVLARTLFEQKQFDEALDACQQALTLDESHLGALQLEEEIQRSIRIRDGLEIPDDALTTADGPTMDPGLTGSKLLQSQVVTGYHDDQFAYTGPPSGTPQQHQTKAPPPITSGGVKPPTIAPVPSQPNSEKTAIRLAAVPVDATIIAPARRTPPPVAAPAAAPSVPATEPVPPGSRAPAAKAKSAAKVPAKKIDRPNPLTTVLQSITAVRQSISSTLRSIVPAQKSKAQMMWAGAGAGVLVVAGIATFLLTRGPVPTGSTIIDAVPWANVIAVRNDKGESQPLPAQASTPLVLTLPEGAYQITLAGPPPESKTETLDMRVEVGRTILVQAPRFRGVTVEEYFEQYIGAGDAPGAAPATETPAAAPASPAPALAAPPAGGQP